MQAFGLRIVGLTPSDEEVFAERVPCVGELVYDADGGSHTVTSVNWEPRGEDQLRAYVVAR